MATDTDTTYRPYRRGPLKNLWPSPALPSRRRSARKADADYGVSAEPGWRDVDWPAHQHDAEIDGTRVHYVDIGSGDRTVVFVHGLGGSWQNWLENIPATAAAGYRTIALDLPGFGASAMPEGDISITSYARTVDHLCDHLGLGPVVLVGNSMGGFISAEVAIRHPERVERLVLVDAAGISTTLYRNRVSERFGRAITQAGNNGGGGATDIEAAKRLMRRPGYIQLAMGIVARHPTLLAKDLLFEQMQSVGAPGFPGALQAIIDYDILDHVPSIACPTFVVQGTKDFLVPVGDAAEWEERIPDATALILDDTGHVPMMERPVVFNRALLEFVGQDVAPATPDPAQAPTVATPGGHA
jgi:pimeloyl-ACP methyl ester carboxylesterase